VPVKLQFEKRRKKTGSSWCTYEDVSDDFIISPSELTDGLLLRDSPGLALGDGVGEVAVGDVFPTAILAQGGGAIRFVAVGDREVLGRNPRGRKPGRSKRAPKGLLGACCRKRPYGCIEKKLFKKLIN
jgi:hypothetical protein